MMLASSVIGFTLALAVGIFARLIGFDRDRAFYPAVLIVVASYNVLFAVMGSSAHAVVDDLLVATPFLLLAAVGFRRNLWLVVAGLAAHGLLDLIHGSVLANDGVPSWWPAFCMSYDLAAAGFLAWALHRSASLSALRVRPRP